MNDKRLAVLAEKLQTLRDKKSQLEGTIKQVQQDLLDEMAEREATGLELAASVGGGDTLIRITAVHPDRVTYDVALARKFLKNGMFERVTQIVIDRDRLESAVKSGDVKLDVVSKFSTVTRIASSVRVTYVEPKS